MCNASEMLESTSRVDSSIPLTHHDPRDLGLICLANIRKIRFRILSADLRIQSWIFSKKRTLSSDILLQNFDYALMLQVYIRISRFDFYSDLF